jgi:LacI family transcriptional regulator
MHELNSTFMLSVLSGIEKVIAETDYDIIIAHSAESGEKEVKNAYNFFLNELMVCFSRLYVHTS